MATKTCPSCDAEVPAAASRCKYCFHDFTEAPPKKKNGLLGLFGLLAAMTLFGACTLAYIFYFNAAERIVVDGETQSIVITRTTATATETERVPFEQVAKVEHVMGGEKAMFEVVAVTNDGKRYIIKRSEEQPMQGHAEHVASVIGKPMEEVRNIKTFGD